MHVDYKAYTFFLTTGMVGNFLRQAALGCLGKTVEIAGFVPDMSFRWIVHIDVGSEIDGFSWSSGSVPELLLAPIVLM